jgi:hypothetical protein
VYQPFDVQAVELHEQAEAGHGADHAIELVAHVFAQVFALQPGLHLARRVVGATLGHRAALAEGVTIAASS